MIIEGDYITIHGYRIRARGVYDMATFNTGSGLEIKGLDDYLQAVFLV